VSIPKKNPAVYIKARVVNQSNYLLLAGQANVFLDNAFVAQAMILFLFFFNKSAIKSKI
jgi:hypothetical protein